MEGVKGDSIDCLVRSADSNRPYPDFCYTKEWLYKARPSFYREFLLSRGHSPEEVRKRTEAYSDVFFDIAYEVFFPTEPFSGGGVNYE